MTNQAAQTMHPDALPDGTLSKSTAKRVEVLASASVSERARELLAAEFEKDGRHDMAAAIRAGHPNWELSLRAIEQALTQQRACATCGGRGEIGGHVGQTAETFDYVTEPCPECTTPQPSADAVRELVKRWRECAKSAANGPMFDGASEYAVAGTYIACADELESLLSGGSHA